MCPQNGSVLEIPRTRPPSFDLVRVIIPARNEQEKLPVLLADLRKQRDLRIDTTVVDGGSTDCTIAMAKKFDVSCLSSEPGRGCQMNHGWRSTKEPWLLFLHADSRLPDTMLIARALRRIQEDPANTAGHFRLQFDDTPHPKPFFYRHLEAKTVLNKAQTFNGDQGLLISRRFLEELGGFDESLPFLEDQAMGDAIRRKGQLITLPGTLHTSARRFETERRAARYFAMLLIMTARECGCDAFLREVPELYREQSQAGPLSIAPLAERLCAEADRRGGSWEKAAAYLRTNAWQLPASLDSVWEGFRRGHRPWLPLYEQHLESRIQQFSNADPAIAQALRFGMTTLLPALLKTRSRIATPRDPKA